MTKIYKCEDCGEEFEQVDDCQWICDNCYADAKEQQKIDRKDFPGGDFDYSMNS